MVLVMRLLNLIVTMMPLAAWASLFYYGVSGQHFVREFTAVIPLSFLLLLYVLLCAAGVAAASTMTQDTDSSLCRCHCRFSLADYSSRNRQAKVYFRETFDDEGWRERWVVPTKWKPAGEMGAWGWTAGAWHGGKEDDKGIQTTEDSR